MSVRVTTLGPAYPAALDLQSCLAGIGDEPETDVRSLHRIAQPEPPFRSQFQKETRYIEHAPHILRVYVILDLPRTSQPAAKVAEWMVKRHPEVDALESGPASPCTDRVSQRLECDV